MPSTIDVKNLRQQGKDAGLPLISWTETCAGVPQGFANRGTAAEQRDAFEKWARHLGMQPRPEKRSGKHICLRAARTAPGETRPHIVLLANILSPL